MNDPQHWLLLIITLPGQNATLRMRLWRAVKALGAAVLRDGAYLLPASEIAAQGLQEQAEEVIAAGGTAYLIPFTSGDVPQAEAFRALFDRTEDYAAFLAKLDEFKRGLSGGKETEARRRLAQLRREFETLSATDYFPGQARVQAQGALAEAEAAVNARFAPDEPTAAPGSIQRRDKADYQGRLWATRERLWVDRVASAWLIRRFIDPDARFLWLKEPQDCPPEAVGFDFDGAEFTHLGARITFEVLMASFDLDEDRALRRIGALVHYLDVGGIPVPEATGFAAILAGARACLPDDDALLDEVGRVLDHLYMAYTEKIV